MDLCCIILSNSKKKSLHVFKKNMNSISFKATYITNSTVRARNAKRKFTDMPVSVYKLNYRKESDYKTLIDVHEKWYKIYSESLTEEIYWDYVKNYKKLDNASYQHEFYVLTKQNDKKQKLNTEDILGIIEYTHDKNKKYDYIDFLQVNPEYMRKKRGRDIKHIGSALLDFIKNKKGFKNIYLDTVPNAVNFYLKNEFKMFGETMRMFFERSSYIPK